MNLALLSSLDGTDGRSGSCLSLALCHLDEASGLLLDLTNALDWAVCVGFAQGVSRSRIAFPFWDLTCEY